MSKNPQLKRNGFAENVAFNRHISSCLSTDNFLKNKIIKSKIFTRFNFITKSCSQGTWFCNKVKTRNDFKFYYFWLYFVNQDFQNGYFRISLLTIIHDFHSYYARSFLRDKTPYRRPYLITCSSTAHSDDGVGKKLYRTYMTTELQGIENDWMYICLFLRSWPAEKFVYHLTITFMFIMKQKLGQTFNKYYIYTNVRLYLCVCLCLHLCLCQ